MGKRLNAENRYNSNGFKVKVGTTNRLSPNTVYIDLGGYLIPQEEKNSYEEDINTGEVIKYNYIRDAVITTLLQLGKQKESQIEVDHIGEYMEVKNMDNKKAAYDYINQYQKEKYDRITILRKAGEKERLTQIAKEKGYRTVTEFINACIDEKINRMKK